MLSKRRFFTRANAAELKRARRRIDTTALNRNFGRDIALMDLPHGTLGVSYIADVDGALYFLKTHLDFAAAQANIEKEIAILEALYGARVGLQKRIIEGRLWLQMDALQPGPELQPSEAQQLLQQLTLPRLKTEDDFSDLLREGMQAFDNLTRRHLISPLVAQRVVPYLQKLTQKTFPRVLCHGDFGPKNVLADAQGPVVIDWEDAFWGIEGYDALYWLSFFSQRKHYEPDMFGVTPWGKEIEVAILLLILVVKCELASLAGTYLTDSLSFDQRLTEILHLA